MFDVETIFTAVERVFEVPRGVFTSSTREHQAKTARFAAALLLHETGRNYTAVGRILQRDRTTINAAVEAAHRDEVHDREFADRIRMARRIAQEAHWLAIAAQGGFGASDGSCPPTRIVRRSTALPPASDDPYEVMAMRADVRRGTDRLGELLRLEAGE